MYKNINMWIEETTTKDKELTILSFLKNDGLNNKANKNIVDNILYDENNIARDNVDFKELFNNLNLDNDYFLDFINNY